LDERSVVKSKWYLLSLVFFFNTKLIASDLLFTQITKTSSGDWSVNYKSSTPIKAVVLSRNPDSSRQNRWKISSNEFSFNRLAGRDIITRKDNQLFTSVTVNLTPTYINLNKDYAPFSPFSDGGMLIHSARFFACSNICVGNENTWALSIKAPKGENVIIDGMVYQQPVSWYDKNDGKKIYIGQRTPTITDSFISIIDTKLPISIKESIQHLLPLLVNELSKYYGAIDKKYMLYASFGKTEGESYGNQGGTLPNQVFMHWYGKKINQRPEALLWFIAHEAAHMFQVQTGNSSTKVDNWIHEGHAEIVAMKLLLTFFPEYTNYVKDRVNRESEQCQAIVKHSTLAKQVNSGNYRALYQCGLTIYKTIESQSGKEATVKNLWLDYISAISTLESHNGELFLDIAKSKYGLSKESYKQFNKLIKPN